MEALTIVWDHWTREEIRVKKENARQRRVQAMETVILHRLHIENYFMYLEAFRYGQEEVHENLKTEGRWLIEHQSPVGACEICGCGVMRFTEIFEGVEVCCTHPECQIVGHVFIGLFAI